MHRNKHEKWRIDNQATITVPDDTHQKFEKLSETPEGQRVIKEIEQAILRLFNQEGDVSKADIEREFRGIEVYGKPFADLWLDKRGRPVKLQDFLEEWNDARRDIKSGQYVKFFERQFKLKNKGGNEWNPILTRFYPLAKNIIELVVFQSENLMITNFIETSEFNIADVFSQRDIALLKRVWKI
ncbi:MAG: hypothetical protein GF311_15185 [Candidatus Lokiarchaeota archaeon]|nr:hypothetical protein [Candidatus Lokiarchaeota archaeon]